MFKSLLAFSFCLLTAVAVSQPVITHTSNPIAGYTYGSFACDTTGITPGAAGASQIWTFTLAHTDTPAVTVSYLSPANTPYASSFPNANLASTYNVGNIYAYYMANADSLTLLGINGTSISIYPEPSIDRKYPLNFLDSFVDSFICLHTFNETTYNSKGSRIVTYDAYGSITINGIIHNNVIRLHSIERNTYSYGTDSTDSYIDSYEWMTANTSDLILRISNTNYTTSNSANLNKAVMITTRTLE